MLHLTEATEENLLEKAYFVNSNRIALECMQEEFRDLLRQLEER